MKTLECKPSNLSRTEQFVTANFLSSTIGRASFQGFVVQGRGLFFAYINPGGVIVDELEMRYQIEMQRLGEILEREVGEAVEYWAEVIK